MQQPDCVRLFLKCVFCCAIAMPIYGCNQSNVSEPVPANINSETSENGSTNDPDTDTDTDNSGSGEGSGESNSTGSTDNTTSDTVATTDSESSTPPANFDNTDQSSSANYCSQYANQEQSYFCADFTGNSPVNLVGSIPPMSFRDQTFRPYTRGEVFNLEDPDRESQHNGVINLHTDKINNTSFKQYAEATQDSAKQWDITAHSRDGYIKPGSGPGFEDTYWWNENQFMGEHGSLCGKPPALKETANVDRNNEYAFTFMEKFFDIPSQWNGDELALNAYWKPEFEGTLGDTAGIHHIVRYEDMIYVCADHLMTTAYGSGASKLSLTPDHLLDTSGGSAVVEFAVSTYRTAGRDYWQIDLSPLNAHLQLPEGDVVADANGKATNGLAINTELNDSMTGPVDLLGGINVFRTMMMRQDEFLDNGNFIDPNDVDARFVRAQIANPGDSERLDLYASAPANAEWVLSHTSYNQIMADYLNNNGDPSASLHNVTDNRSRTKFKLTLLKTPTASPWSTESERWDQVSLCLPEYGGGCVGEYIIPELPNELLVQFTHYAYNTTKSCSNGGEQPHKNDGPIAASNRPAIQILTTGMTFTYPLPRHLR